MSLPEVAATRRLAPVIRLARAKLNLTLAVVGRRPDGFHALHSVAVPLALADRLSVSPAPPGASDSLHVTGFDPGHQADNLVMHAVTATRQAVGRIAGGVPGPLAIRLEKHIPVAAGLGGGSADAAAAVDGALEAWGLSLDAHRRLAVAIGLGSDVAFFLADGPALLEGRGERVTPLPWLAGQATPGVVLVTPRVPISTAAVFVAFARTGTAGSPPVRLASEHLEAELRQGLTAHDLVVRAGVLSVANDLVESAIAVEPRLRAFRRALVRQLGRPVGMTGSGPTHWVLYPSRSDAEAAAAALRLAFAAGDLEAPGDDAPLVVATTVVAPPGDTTQERRQGGNDDA